MSTSTWPAHRKSTDDEIASLPTNIQTQCLLEGLDSSSLLDPIFRWINVFLNFFSTEKYNFELLLGWQLSNCGFQLKLMTI